MWLEAKIVGDSTPPYALFIAPILVFLGVALGKFVDYIIVRSGKTGSIKTTDADTLWTAQQLFLESILKQLGESKVEIVSLREQNTKLQERISVLDDELSDMEERVRRETRRGPNHR